MGECGYYNQQKSKSYQGSQKARGNESVQFLRQSLQRKQMTMRLSAYHQMFLKYGQFLLRGLRTIAERCCAPTGLNEGRTFHELSLAKSTHNHLPRLFGGRYSIPHFSLLHSGSLAEKSSWLFHFDLVCEVLYNVLDLILIHNFSPKKVNSLCDCNGLTWSLY
jgi:hypothetical protein